MMTIRAMKLFLQRHLSMNLLAWLVLATGLLAGASASAACTTTGACLSAGPRLASVDTTRAALLNPLLGGLLGTNLSLTAADWNSVAQGEVNLLGFLTKLQAQTNVSSPAQALAANATLGQITTALGLQAQAQANTSLSGVLSTLATQLNGAGATVKVGDLVKLTADIGSLGSTTVNSLDMLTGLIQLYNKRNVLTTPTPVGISGGVLGQAGVLNSVQLYTQVIEPAVYICGPTGSTFHTAAIRVKLKLDLVTLAPVTNTLTALLGTTQIAIGQLDVYVEIGRGEGTLRTVDAVSRAVTMDVSPGVADVYIGKIADTVFFNRSRTINPATDLDYGKIGSLQLVGLDLLSIEVKASARGNSSVAVPVSMSGTFPQTKTVTSSSTFTTSLVTSLMSNLSVRVPGLLSLDLTAVLGALKGIVVVALPPVLNPVLTGVVDPLLQLLGIGLGQVVVTVNGIGQACDEFKLVKAADKANAQPGTMIAYTITYQNTGTTTITNLKIVDATPAYTVFGTSACGTLAGGLTGCAVSTQPAAGATGGVEWNFTGTLMPGATGTVTLNVVVQ